MFKKRFTILFMMVMSIFMSTASFAEDSLSITRWVVDSTLLEDGSLQISEDLTFNFKDKFNGVFRNIVLKDTSGIDGLKLYEMVEGKEVEYSLDINAKKGDTNVFKTDTEKDTNKLTIFSPSEDEQKTFRIKYTLGDVAIKHSDTSELYYQFLGRENSTPIDYFSAIINLPSKDREKTKIFAHGPSNGEIKFVEDNLIKLEVSNVPTDTFIEARILFPNSFIPAIANIGNRTFKDIMDEELSLTKAIEKNTESKAKSKILFNNISIAIASLGTLLVAFITNKLRRNPDIYEDLKSLSPEEITPAELRLFHSQVSDSRSLMTTIFDLSRKGYITIDEGDELKKKKKKEFIFSKVSKSANDLISHELYILDWIFNIIGDDATLSTKDIDDYRKKNSGNFYKEFNLWQSKLKADLKNREYYDTNGKKSGGIMLLISLISFVIAIITVAFGGLYGIPLILLAFFTFFYGIILFYRKSDKGYIEYQMWKDYKKNLEFQGKIPENYDQNIPKDKDLIYGLALGLTMKSLDNFRQRMPETYMSNHWVYWYFLTNPKGGSRFEDSFNTSFYGSAASTTTSTSVGGGGGFSGGGGGGAGGGGAGGF